MPSYRIAMSTRAKTRLRDICRYLEHDLDLHQSSTELLGELRAKFGVLSTFPFAYSVDEEASSVIGREIRGARIRSFRLLYWVDKQRETVLVFSMRFGNESPASLCKSDFSL